MLTETLVTLFTRDLNKLKSEIMLYNNEQHIWLVHENITNSAGNLTLHLVGNINHFIGKVLGNVNYERQRDLEFSLKDVPRNELIEKIDGTIAIVTKVLPSLNDEQISSDYPLIVFKEKMSTEYFLIHLATHLGYHLGQINYHRRLLDKS